MQQQKKNTKLNESSILMFFADSSMTMMMWENLCNTKKIIKGGEVGTKMQKFVFFAIQARKKNKWETI